MTGLSVTRKGSRRGDPQDKPFVNRSCSARHGSMCGGLCAIDHPSTTGDDLGRRHSGDTAVLGELCGDEGQWGWSQDHTGTLGRARFRWNGRDSIHCAGKSLDTRLPAAVTLHEGDSVVKSLMCASDFGEVPELVTDRLSKIVDVPAPLILEELFEMGSFSHRNVWCSNGSEVRSFFPQERVQQRIEKQIVDVPAPQLCFRK